MSKELEQQIKKTKETIADLEKKLKQAESIFTLISNLEKSDIKEHLASQYFELATLYKKNEQIDEALQQLKITYDFYNSPNQKKVFNQFQLTQKCIEILDLQIQCSQASNNQEMAKIFLGEILILLPSVKSHTHKKNISQYLKDYVAYSPVHEGLDKIDFVIENLDCNLLNDSVSYRYALNLKIDLTSDLADFKSTYTTLLKFIDHYENLNKRPGYGSSHLIEGVTPIYLNAFSLACVKDFVVGEKVQLTIDNHYQKSKINEIDYEVQFESSFKHQKEDELRKTALLYHHLKLPHPKWFPKHSINQLNISSLFADIPRQELNDNSKPRLPKLTAEQSIPFIEDIDMKPVHEKIREKITMDWEAFGVGGYKSEIKDFVSRLFIPWALSPEDRKKTMLKLPKGAILYGPPGTGKTLMAKSVAEHFFKCVTVINGPELITKYVGQPTQDLINILEKPKSNPSEIHVVIIDEIDALFCSRDGADEGLTKQVKSDLTTTLMTYLEGIKVVENLIVIGLTNYMSRLDKALIRSGRLQVHIEVGAPNLEDRRSILNVHLTELQKNKMVSLELDVELLARETKGLTGANIKAFIDETVNKYILSQIAYFDKGELKFGDINNIVPLEAKHFLDCLNTLIKANTRKLTEKEVLLSRPLCQFNPSFFEKALNFCESSHSFAYCSPMLVGVSGISGSGTTSFALNLFQKSTDEIVYMKAGELVNLTAREQEKYIDDCFSNALLRHGVLILDDLEDISSCSIKPEIYLRNKLKMALTEGEALNIILISKKEDTLNTLFNHQIDCDAIFRIPLISKKQELVSLIKTLGLEMDLSLSTVEMKSKLSIGKLKTILMTYCNKTKPEERTLTDFVESINSMGKPNTNRLFKEKPQLEYKSADSGVTNSF